MREQEVRLRLTAKGKKELVDALRGMGQEGQKAAEKIERSGRSASRGLKGIDAAVKDLKGSLRSAASRIPVVGSGLSAMGGAGLAAAAGIGALGVALGASLRVSREAVREFDRIAKASRELGTSTDFFQAMRLQADEASIGWDNVSRAIVTFERNAAKAATGRGEMVELLRATHPELLAEIANLETAEERLEAYRLAMRNAGSQTERTLLQTAAFGESGVAVGRMLTEQSESMDELTRRAREMGVVIDESVLARAEEMETQLSVASRVIDLNLKQAFVDLAPFLVSTAEFLADLSRGLRGVATSIGQVLDEFKELGELSLPELELRQDRLENHMLVTGLNPYDLEDSRRRAGDSQTANRQIDELEQVRARIAAIRGVNAASPSSGDDETDASLTRTLELTRAVAQAREQAISPAERLAASIAELREAREEGIIATDAELERLIVAAQARHAGAQADRAAAQHAQEAARVRAELGDQTGMLALEQARLNAIVESGNLTSEEAARALEQYRERLLASSEAGQRARQITEQMATPIEQYTAAIAELDDLLAQHAITETVHARAVEAATRVYESADPVMAAAARVREELAGSAKDLAREEELVNQAVERGEISFEEGATYLKAYREAMNEATDANKELRLENELLDRVLAKQVSSWKDLGQVALDVLTDIIREQIRLADASQGLGAFFSQILSGFTSSFGGKTEAAAGKPTFHSGTGRVSASSLSAAYRTASPLGAGEALAKVKKDERIFTAEDNRTLLTMIDQALKTPAITPVAMGGGDLVIRFADQRSRDGLEVSERRDGRGGREIDVMIRDLTEGQIAGGAFDGAFDKRYGLRPAMARR